MAKPITHVPQTMSQVIAERGMEKCGEYQCRRAGEKQDVAIADLLARHKGKP